MQRSTNDTIRDIRNHKEIFSLGTNSQKILKESLGASVFADIEQDPQALGVLFNLYDEQSSITITRIHCRLRLAKRAVYRRRNAQRIFDGR